MQCPHCTVNIHPVFSETRITDQGSIFFGAIERLATMWVVSSMVCPACGRPILTMTGRSQDGTYIYGPHFIYPRATSRAAAPVEVPTTLAEDYKEACAVLTDSPKASAALSRRCLQNLLAGQGYTQKDLAKAIDAVLQSRTLGAHLSENLDAIRNIGNFAAHPLKDTNSGAILPVEPDEAEWNLDVLVGLFDFYYVQPARAQAKRAALDAKLTAAGKPPMKK